jgi:hypothetical protein
MADFLFCEVDAMSMCHSLEVRAYFPGPAQLSRATSVMPAVT